MAQGPRHLRDSFVAAGLRFTEQDLSAAQIAQALANLGISGTLTVGGGGSLLIGGGGSLTVGGISIAFTTAPCPDSTYTNPTSITTVGGLITAIS